MIILWMYLLMSAKEASSAPASVYTAKITLIGLKMAATSDCCTVENRP